MYVTGVNGIDDVADGNADDENVAPMSNAIAVLGNTFASTTKTPPRVNDVFAWSGAATAIVTVV